MITIFNSWQSDLPSSKNRGLISKAIKTLEDNNSNWYFDEATRDSPGSPDISIELENKIRKSDIFIADVSIINSAFGGKKMSNPNVLFELGIALGVLGWGRIILIINEEYGVATEVSFDILKHRAIRYNTAESSKIDLSKSIKNAIEQIESSNPPKQIFKTRSIEEIKHDRDVIALKGLLNYIDLTALSARATDGPRQLRYSVINYSDFLDIALNDVTFSLYDKDTEEMIRNIQGTLHLTFDGYYKNVGNGQFDVWSLPGDIFMDSEEEKKYKKVQEACLQLGKLVRDLSERIKNSYLEIDLNETNLNARKFLAAP